jgi:hypothetical protein
MMNAYVGTMIVELTTLVTGWNIDLREITLTSDLPFE